MVEIIAELGWNFIGDMDLATNMVRAAKNSGAGTAKFQYWNPAKLKSGAWDHDGRREIYEKAFLTPEKIKLLQDVCKENDIKFLISVFNEGDALDIKNLGIKEIKIPSHEVANVKLHKFAAAEFQKCYVSMGAGSWEELCRASEIYNSSNCGWVAMHCVSSYPCPVDKINLQKLSNLRHLHHELGFSDHTQCIVTPALSVAQGCKVIEKHFTSDNSLPGRDNKFALNPDNFLRMVENIKIAEDAFIERGITASDLEKDTINNYRGRWGD
jgi:N,N'-diacetyllegionaminate synthase